MTEKKGLIKFIHDDPAKVNKVLFGHDRIINAIVNIITNDSIPQNFTIGLFGKYGVGKSVIVNKVKNRIEETPNSKIAVVLIDVWKYEKESLKRVFIYEVVNQLKNQNKLSNRFQINSRINKKIR